MINLYFNTIGRLNRKEYWTSLLLLFTLLLLNQLLLILRISPRYYTFGLILYGVILIAIAWSSTIIIIKRLHDLNKSGSIAFLNFIPIINVIFIIIIGLLKRTQEENNYIKTSNSLLKKNYILPKIITISAILIIANIYLSIKFSDDTWQMTTSKMIAKEITKSFEIFQLKFMKKQH